MAGSTWTSTPQKEYGHENMPSYHEAVLKGRKAIRIWFSSFEPRWTEKFPMKEELIKEGKLGEHVLQSNYAMTTAEAKLYQEAMERRSGQIKTWFRYHHSKIYGDVGKGVGGGNKNSVTHAAKAFVTGKRRVHKRIEVFYKLNQDWLDPMITIAMDDYRAKVEKGEIQEKAGEKAGGKDDEDDEDDENDENDEDEEKDDLLAAANRAEAKRRGWNLTVRNEVIQREFEDASEDALRAVAEAVIQEKEEMRREADLERSGSGLARSPQLRKQAVERVQAFMVENGRTMWNQAAMATITVGVAPDPDKPGKLKSMIVAHGRNTDGLLFTDVEPEFCSQIAAQLRAWSRTNLFNALAKHEAHIAKLDSRDAGEGEEVEGDTPEADSPSQSRSSGSIPTGTSSKTSDSNLAKPSKKNTSSTIESSTNTVPTTKTPQKGTSSTTKPSKDGRSKKGADSISKSSTKHASSTAKSGKNNTAARADPAVETPVDEPRSTIETSGPAIETPADDPSSTIATSAQGTPGGASTQKPRPRPLPVKHKGVLSLSGSDGDGDRDAYPEAMHPRGLQPLPGDLYPQTIPAIPAASQSAATLPVFTGVHTHDSNSSQTAHALMILTGSRIDEGPPGGPSEPIGAGLQRAGFAGPTHETQDGLSEDKEIPENEKDEEMGEKDEKDRELRKDEAPHDSDSDDEPMRPDEDQVEGFAADPSFDGASFWAKLKTNIPSKPTAPAKEKVAGGVRKKKGSAKSKKSKAKTTAKKTSGEKAASQASKEVGLNAGDEEQNPPANVKQPRAAKRKAPASVVDATEGGRPKRIRKDIVLPDGTTFSGRSQSKQVQTVQAEKKTGGAKGKAKAK